VISRPKTSCSKPAIAFPSSAIVISSAPCRSEALRPDPPGLVTELDEAARRVLDEPGRSAHVDERPLLGWPGDLLEQLPVEPAPAAPPRRVLAEPGRSAHVDERPLLGWPGDLLEQLPVEPAPVALPSLRRFAREREADVDVAVDALELVTVDHVVERAGRVEQ